MKRCELKDAITELSEDLQRSAIELANERGLGMHIGISIGHAVRVVVEAFALGTDAEARRAGTPWDGEPPLVSDVAHRAAEAEAKARASEQCEWSWVGRTVARAAGRKPPPAHLYTGLGVVRCRISHEEMMMNPTMERWVARTGPLATMHNNARGCAVLTRYGAGLEEIARGDALALDHLEPAAALIRQAPLLHGDELRHRTEVLLCRVGELVDEIAVEIGSSRLELESPLSSIDDARRYLYEAPLSLLDGQWERVSHLCVLAIGSAVWPYTGAAYSVDDAIRRAVGPLRAASAIGG